METFNIEMEEAGICSFKFGHSFTSGSLHSNMNEIIGLRSTKITVNYLPGNVSYSDSWYTERQ